MPGFLERAGPAQPEPHCRAPWRGPRNRDRRVHAHHDSRRRDGTPANNLIGSTRTTTAGAYTAKYTPSASGYWTVRVVQTSTLKTSLSVRKYVKVTNPTSYRPPDGSWNCPSWAPIKGNLSSHIYHLPWQRFYSKTKPEMCFATEAAAIKAGYRKSKV
ncbi:sunset domain-containing protein [Calidifontibacter terrae]